MVSVVSARIELRERLEDSKRKEALNRPSGGVSLVVFETAFSPKSHLVLGVALVQPLRFALVTNKEHMNSTLDHSGLERKMNAIIQLNVLRP